MFNIIVVNFGGFEVRTLSELEFDLDLGGDFVMEGFDFVFVVFLDFVNLFILQFQEFIFLVEKVFHEKDLIFEFFEGLKHEFTLILIVGDFLGS